MKTEHEIHADHPHSHGNGCGHVAVNHNGHTDYLDNAHLRHPHGDHVDYLVNGLLHTRMAAIAITTAWSNWSQRANSGWMKAPGVELSRVLMLLTPIPLETAFQNDPWAVAPKIEACAEVHAETRF